MGKTYFNKRLLGKEDIDFDANGTGARNDFIGTDGETKELHKLNATHIPLSTSSRWDSITDVDNAIGNLHNAIGAIAQIEVLPSDTTTTLDLAQGQGNCQEIVDASIHNLNGHTLTFQFTYTSGAEFDLTSTFEFSNFYNGKLVINLNNTTFSDGAINFDQLFSILNCECPVIIENGTLKAEASTSCTYCVKTKSVLSVEYCNIVFSMYEDTTRVRYAFDTNGVFSMHTGTTECNVAYVNPETVLDQETSQEITDIKDATTEHTEQLADLQAQIDELKGTGSVAEKNFMTVFGENSDGLFGIGIASNVNMTSVGYPENCSLVDLGAYNGVAIFNNNLYTTGLGSYGYHGTTDTADAYGWHLLSSLQGWTDCTCGAQNGAAIRNGHLYTWGNNNYGELGTGDKTDRYSLFRVLQHTNDASCTTKEFFTDSTSFVKVFRNAYDLFVLDNNNKLWCCGYNNKGQLGVGTTSVMPLLYNTAQNVKEFSTGGTKEGDVWYFSSMYINTSGVLFVCGSGAWGELGLGNTTNYSTWQEITTRGTSSDGKQSSWQADSSWASGSHNDWLKCSAGGLFNAALNTSGEVFIAGHSQIFLNKGNCNRFTKIKLPTLYTGEYVCDISASYSSLIMLTNKGRVLGWGYNTNYCLGETSNVYVPTSWSGTAKFFICNGSSNLGASKIFSSSRHHNGAFITNVILKNGVTPAYTAILVSEHLTSALNTTYSLVNADTTGTDRVFQAIDGSNNYYIFYNIDAVTPRWELATASDGTGTLYGHATIDGTDPTGNLSWVDENGNDFMVSAAN